MSFYFYIVFAVSLLFIVFLRNQKTLVKFLYYSFLIVIFLVAFLFWQVKYESFKIDDPQLEKNYVIENLTTIYFRPGDLHIRVYKEVFPFVYKIKEKDINTKGETSIYNSVLNKDYDIKNNHIYIDQAEIPVK
ncbi:hypothetical protein GMB86_11610 [Terrilactibacillus sp. BCM23-1]|uniref:Uncharacterized protein n=1 Tax=Terrilactibacillus tamarindi TaxID=2599694 RepID=A0A6N8CR51_9BACI|nr:hypothetical protein [Terrilactibacillus tamarindi]